MIDLDALTKAAARLAPLPASATRLAGLVCGGAPELGQVPEITTWASS